VRPALGGKLAAQEKDIIEAALAATRGRVAGPSGAAATLGMPSTTLESKIKSLKIDKYRFKTAGHGKTDYRLNYSPQNPEAFLRIVVKLRSLRNFTTRSLERFQRVTRGLSIALRQGTKWFEESNDVENSKISPGSIRALHPQWAHPGRRCGRVAKTL